LSVREESSANEIFTEHQMDLEEEEEEVPHEFAVVPTLKLILYLHLNLGAQRMKKLPANQQRKKV
jgi:hypothetical protein